MSSDVSPVVSGLPSTASPTLRPSPTRRLGSIDAYRGLVMFLMMAEVLRFCAVASAVPGNTIWEFLCHHQSHVEWVGCVLHDMIQPSFSFLVGVALPFSLASRLARGQSPGRMTAHAVWRSLVLVFLGVFLRSIGHRQTNFTFEDTLSQIGLGYTFLFLLGMRSVRVQWIAFVAIVVGYWALFAAYPVRAGFRLPGRRRSRGLAASDERLPGALEQEQQPGLGVRRLVPQPVPAVRAVPGQRRGLRDAQLHPHAGDDDPGPDRRRDLEARTAALVQVRLASGGGSHQPGAGLGAGRTGHLPGGEANLDPQLGPLLGRHLPFFLAFFYAVIDWLGWSLWSFPLRVIGANSIAAYCLSHLIEDFITDNLKTHLGRDVFNLLGAAYAPFLQGVAVLLVLWLILFWMYRRRLFLRI